MKLNPDMKAWKKEMLEILGKTKHLLDKGREGIVKVSRASKVQIDQSFLRRDRNRLAQRLGEQVYRKAKTGHLKLPPDLDSLVSGIERLEQKIEEKKDKLVNLRATRTPSKSKKKLDAEK